MGKNYWEKNNENKHDNIDENLNSDNDTPISHLTDLYDQTNNHSNSHCSNIGIDEQREQEIPTQEDIPLLSVLEAKRASEGIKKVIGRILGKSTTFRVISATEWSCKNSECDNTGSTIFNPPLLNPLSQFDNTKGIKPSCFKCGKYGSLNVYPEYRNAKIIQLDDINTIEEKFDRLDVILYDDASNNIIDSEIVEIEVFYIHKKRLVLYQEHPIAVNLLIFCIQIKQLFIKIKKR